MKVFELIKTVLEEIYERIPLEQTQKDKKIKEASVSVVITIKRQSPRRHNLYYQTQGVCGLSA